MRVLLLILMLLTFVPPSLAATDYICPMHPHIHGSAGETCPICGMELVPANDQMSMKPDMKAEDMESESSNNAIHINATYRQALGVKTTQASSEVFGKSIHAFGHIEPSTRLEHSVDVRTAGWIVALNADAIGDTVKKGDLLFTYYSTELMAAQSDYLIGNRAGNAEQRLHLFGMDNKAIEELKKTGKFLEQTPFYAPADGTVITLNARKGAYLEKGNTLLTLQDYSQLWIKAHLPLRDLDFIKVGTPAMISVDETGERFKAEVDFVYPMTDPQSRNGMVRIVVNNAEGRLKTDALVNIMLMADSETRLAVPEQAVLYGGHGAYVIEALGDGYYQPVMVETGITAHGMTEITQGLSKGQEIVVSGQFMIDAESNLQGGMAAMGHDHGSTSDNPPVESAKQEGESNVHKH